MEINVNQYNFDKICDRMKSEFGVIKKGEEEKHMMMLFPMEGNLLKTHRTNPSSNGRRLLEAISLVLFQIRSYLTGEEFNLSGFRTTDNERLVHALLMAFDLFTNEEIKEVLEQDKTIDLTDRNQLKLLFKEPVMCILRIKESADIWEKRMGINGYFSFIEEYIGSSIPQEEELKYTVYIGGNRAGK